MLSRTGTIKDVSAWEILDSRGNPTVAVEVKLFDGTVCHGCRSLGSQHRHL